MDKQKNDQFWYHFTKYARAKGVTFPPCLRILLKKCGYESTLSFKGLNAEDLVGIQNYINKNLKDVLNNLKCCQADQYKKQEVFSFLPGHKSFILNLPQYIDEFLKEKCLKQKASKYMLRNTQQLTENNVEDIEEDKMDIVDFDTDAIKEILLKKYKETAKSLKISGTMINIALVDDLTKSSENNLTMKSKLKCFLCNKIVSVQFNKYWYLSNFTKHLKTHVKEVIDIQVTDNIIINSNETSRTSSAACLTLVQKRGLDITNISNEIEKNMNESANFL